MARLSHRLLVPLVVLGVLLLALAVPAVAKKHYGTTANVSAGAQYSGPSFVHRDVVSSVSSKKPSCRSGRHVKLLFFGTGTDPATVVGTGTTDRYGVFAVHYDAANPTVNGRYAFKVSRKNLGRTAVCRGDTSPRFTL